MSDGSDATATELDPERARMTVGVFRPDDERLADAVELLEALGADPVPDPMLAVDPTGATPREDADVAVLTSTTGVEIADDAGWDPGDADLAAIGSTTADALRGAGYAVDVVPEEFSSAGLVEALAPEADGRRVEVARSDHGSSELIEGLERAGAYVHETVLYELVHPDGSGRSAELAADGDLDVALFTSSLTVEHFLDAAEERGIREAAIEGLNDPDAVVGAIGDPTRATARAAGIPVDVVPETASFDRLATAAVEDAAPSHH